MPQIKIENLTVTYLNKGETINALNDFSALFDDGKINVVVGYSGCGKSTLLRAIGGLTDYEGKILFDEADVSDIPVAKRNVAFVTQNYALYPHMTVFDNIAFPLKTIRLPVEEIRSRVVELAKKLDIFPCLSRKPKQISGGQQQRVALARALVKKPDVCLLDEPLSNIDEQLRFSARQLIKKAVSESGCTTIYVTHDIVEAVSLADKLFVVDGGKLETFGSPQQVLSSQSSVVKELKIGLSGWSDED